MRREERMGSSFFVWLLWREKVFGQIIPKVP